MKRLLQNLTLEIFLFSLVFYEYLFKIRGKLSKLKKTERSKLAAFYLNRKTNPYSEKNRDFCFLKNLEFLTIFGKIKPL